jgi:hypothetical protein
MAAPRGDFRLLSPRRHQQQHRAGRTRRLAHRNNLVGMAAARLLSGINGSISPALSNMAACNIAYSYRTIA